MSERIETRRGKSSFLTTIRLRRYLYDFVILDFHQGTSLQDHNLRQE